MKPDQFLAVSDFESRARRFLPRCIQTYICDGVEDDITLRANREAFQEISFLARGLAGVSERNQEVELWGKRYPTAVAIAPMGAAAVCRDEVDLDLARAAAKVGIPFILSGASTVPLERVQQEAPGIWYQGYLPGDTERIGALMDRVQAAGIDVLVITIDTAVGPNGETHVRSGFTIPPRLSARLLFDGMLHPDWSFNVFAKTLLRDGIPRFTNMSADSAGFPITVVPTGGFRHGRDLLTWEHVEWIRARWRGKIVIKGVLHPEDARLAVTYGADGVIVSNHGGRTLDSASATLRALPAVLAAVPADFPVMVDSGFRRGTDVVKAIALGARMVFLGRPMLYGATVGGTRGVLRVIEILRAEIDRTLALLGCSRLEALTADWLVPASSSVHATNIYNSSPAMAGVRTPSCRPSIATTAGSAMTPL
ncbi:TPA: alpha-hydroxy acid oxidase [Burkholderia cepacia]|uniref:alpha-hydroxy acid oxidase n=1 Tax=Burkholderia cepacia TaxID=292 RepID=UPI001CF43098|nr:alpha-hydroxy acid oxidase [Burkholderia cepacia]MCA8357563.1 alpha-hydroxy-acid oxidizing protein [Burkholderia cepacia]HDR9761123.1 alpha-hydroxy-acid oxidizing protein [Burkholderia cepacia ATCC 25416]HDV6368326.1 alpha-hydroxy-acid oxidizing protein [Burkholderia cepacia]